MKKLIVICLSLFLVGCNYGTTSVLPSNNFQEIDIKNTTKRGESCDVVIPLLLSAGPIGKNRSSVVEIAREHKIEKITYVDKHYKGIIPFFYEKCYTVYGY